MSDDFSNERQGGWDIGYSCGTCGRTTACEHWNVTSGTEPDFSVGGIGVVLDMPVDEFFQRYEAKTEAPDPLSHLTPEEIDIIAETVRRRREE